MAQPGIDLVTRPVPSSTRRISVLDRIANPCFNKRHYGND